MAMKVLLGGHKLVFGGKGTSLPYCLIGHMTRSGEA